jgi:hypothetical protein
VTNNPLYVINLTTLRESGELIMTKARIAEEAVDDPAVRAAVLYNIRDQRARFIAENAPGQTPIPETEQWWIGDDADDAFIRNRDPKPLTWEEVK